MPVALNGGGGAPHPALIKSLVCLAGAPPSVYNGGREGAGPLGVAHQRGGVLLGVGLPLLVGLLLQGGKGGREREKERGVRPLVQFGLPREGAQHPLAASPSLPYGPIRPISSPVNSRNSPVLRKIPESLGTYPTSEYSLPIYRSLPLGHSETPLHVHDLIRDSEQLRSPIT
jgi:hypothetical protein